MSETGIRERYRANWRVNYRTFIPCYCFSLAAAGFLAWVNYSVRGWTGFERMMAVIFSAIFALLAVRCSWSLGKCRNGLIVFGTAFAAVLVVFVGSYYIGMLETYGRQGLFRMDLLLEYFRFRMQTDADNGGFRIDESLNLMLSGIELLLILVFAWKMAGQFAAFTFCERCNRWQIKETQILPPGMARDIAGWVAGGELHNLAAVPRYVLGRDKQKYTAVVVQRCAGNSATEECPVYLTVREASGKGLLVESSGVVSGGRAAIRRERLAREEIAAIRPAFSFWNAMTEMAERQRSFTPPAGVLGKFIRVESIAEGDGPFIAPWIKSVSVVYAVANLILALLAPIFIYVAIERLRLGNDAEFGQFMIWVGVLAGCVGFSSFQIYVTTRNPGALLIKLSRWRAGRIVSRRTSKIVDPEQSGESPVEYAEIVPRENWLKVMIETSTDCGFLQFDRRKREIRFEGGHERMVIPVDAIQDLALVPVNKGARVAYCMTVLQCRTQDGTREISFLPQSTRFSAARIPTGKKLHARFKEMTSPDEVEAPALPERAVQYAPQKGILKKYWWRLALVGLVLSTPYLTKWEQRQAASRMWGIGREDNATLRLPLQITNVRTNKEIADEAPYIRDGGNWTVFDCAPADDPQATMTIAVKPTDLGVDSPLRMAEGAIVPENPATGGIVLTAMAYAFNRAVPDPRSDGAALELTRLNLTIIGEHLVRSSGKLQAGAGTWVACTWWMPGELSEDEVFFNYDLVGMQAEFRVRRADSNLLTSFAVALRDGPLPLRTAANDPLFIDGPQVSAPVMIPDSQDFRPDFVGSDRELLLIGQQSPAELRAVPLDGKLASVPVAKFDGTIGEVWRVDQDSQQLLAEEFIGTPGKERQKSNLWLIDRKKNEKKRLSGPWGDASIYCAGVTAISKDGQFIAVSSAEGNLLRDANTANYIVKLADGAAVKVDMKSVFFAGWLGEGENLRALFVNYDQSAIKPEPRTWAVSPSTGRIEPAAKEMKGPDNLSPDGRYAYSIRERLGVMIKDDASRTNRLLEFESRDLNYLDEETFSWINPRYIGFEGDHPMFVDVESMKMGYLPTYGKGKELRTFEFSPNMKWAAVSTKEGVMLGTVTIPPPAKSAN